MEEKIERVNNDLENNWWNYEIFLKERIEVSDEKIKKQSQTYIWFSFNDNWKRKCKKINSRQSIYVFKGDVYQGLNIESFSKKDTDFAQKHLRILSGLYGILKPLDVIEPYRLEMGTKLNNKRGKNLYEFWNEKITDSLNNCLTKNNAEYLLNLSSNEYFLSIQTKRINKRIIEVKFLDKKNDIYKIISFFAKKAAKINIFLLFIYEWINKKL